MHLELHVRGCNKIPNDPTPPATTSPGAHVVCIRLLHRRGLGRRRVASAVRQARQLSSGNDSEVVADPRRARARTVGPHGWLRLPDRESGG
jgi:hypothetical protein